MDMFTIKPGEGREGKLAEMTVRRAVLGPLGLDGLYCTVCV